MEADNGVLKLFDVNTFDRMRVSQRAEFHPFHLSHLGARTEVARFWLALGSFSHR